MYIYLFIYLLKQEKKKKKMTSYFAHAYKVSTKYSTSRNYAIIFWAQR